ncbi:site-specific integrase [Actinacidiphila glaucinigra]|uniref:site-specific integrase n=1 Tax=Actinacidiphila glaucinigra TaxID=235986 RepID=UPI0037B3FA59
MDGAEAKMLLKAARDHRLYAPWLLPVSTGLRRGEVLGLTWTDVDPTNGQLRVRRNLQRIKRELIFGTPKTRRSVRTVSLPKRCVAALTAHEVTQTQERARRRQQAAAPPAAAESFSDPRKLAIRTDLNAGVRS